jgi:hypothetical protein
MGARELAAYIDRTGLASIAVSDGIKIPVKVKDARSIFGRTELKVTPIGGSGETWITVGNFEEKKL